MPEISLGKIIPTAIASGSGALKAYLDNGNQVGSLPIVPTIILDLIALTSQVVYTFDTDLTIESISLSSAIAFTLQIERIDGTLITNIVTSASIPSTKLFLVAGEQLKVSAASSLNARLVLAKTHIETKI